MKESNIEFHTIVEWEENWDELFSRVENGETIGVINEDGNKVRHGSCRQ